jgi:WD40 repeat protein
VRLGAGARVPTVVALVAALAGLTGVAVAGSSAPIAGVGAPAQAMTPMPEARPAAAASPVAPASSAAPASSSEIHHYEYVFDDGLISVYDMDNSQKLIKTIGLPQTEEGIRGVTVAPSTHLLFISYGGDGTNFNGSVLAYDLVAEKVVWTVHLKTGIDSGEVSPDGKRLYMPTGENTPSGIWNILNTENGAVVGTIQGGSGAHNTIASNDGRYVYLGGREHDYLDVYDTTTGKVREIGPLINTVRPFTVNAENTLAFTTATEFDGFQVSSIATGKVLFTVSFGSVPKGFPFSGPSHGASLSPDEKQLYVIDSPNKAVRVYDVSRVAEGVAPTELGVIPVAGLSGDESPCAYDCTRGGWVQHSLDGRFVYVGDSGEVIETATRKVLTTLPTLLNTKKTLEIDWSGGVPVATSGRTGVGYGAGATGPPPHEEGPPAEEEHHRQPGEGPPAEEEHHPQPESPGSTPSAQPGGSPLSSSLAPSAPVGAAAVAGYESTPGAVAVISDLTVSPHAFRTARGSTPRRGAGGTGATVAFLDSESSTTSFTVLELRPAPRRSRGACHGSGRRRSGSGRELCAGYVTIGRFARRDRAGRNRFGLDAWSGARTLGPGSYRLQAVPVFGGRSGARVTVAFQVVR